MLGSIRGEMHEICLVVKSKHVRSCQSVTSHIHEYME